MMMNLICTILSLSLMLLTCACHSNKKPPATAAEVLSVMLNSVEAPQGRIRSFSSFNQGSLLSSDLLTALYGSTAAKWYQTNEQAVIDDGALYLSEILHPFELAVFRCIDEGDTSGSIASVLGVCASRLELIRKAWQGTTYENYINRAIVTCYDGYVLLVVAKDPDTAIKAARNYIKNH